MLFFKKRIEAEQSTQKTQKTGKRKSKNDHASAVRVQKLLNHPFFTRGQTVYNVVHKYKVLPSHNSSKPRVRIWTYSKEVGEKQRIKSTKLSRAIGKLEVIIKINELPTNVQVNKDN
jgi:hypothetical protein